MENRLKKRKTRDERRTFTLGSNWTDSCIGLFEFLLFALRRSLAKNDVALFALFRRDSVLRFCDDSEESSIQ
jgi:hypothetical protein